LAFVFLGLDEADWSFIFAGLTFVFATYLSISSLKSGRRFIESQVDEKVAVLYGLADGIDGLRNRVALSKVQPSLGKYTIDHILSNIRAVDRIANDASKNERSRLFEAEAALVSTLRESGFNSEAEKVDKLFRSFFC
jgi:hypothetical protein